METCCEEKRWTRDVVLDRMTHPITEITSVIRGVKEVIDGNGRVHPARYYQKINMTTGECVACVFNEEGDFMMNEDRTDCLYLDVKHTPPLSVNTDYGVDTEEYVRSLLTLGMNSQ